MDRLRELLRAVFISPEVLVTGIIALGAAFVPSWVRSAGSAFLSGDVPNVLAVLGAPFALVMAAYTLSGSVLRPHGERTVLRTWSEYWRLRLRVVVALGYTLVGSIAVTVGWVLFKAHWELTGSAVSLAGAGIAAVAVATIAHARQDVEDIVDRLS